ncbi:MAG: HutD family protein [Rhodanobacter sp.]|nr:MAG: HutD family protein [Rhodanobacter sp.]
MNSSIIRARDCMPQAWKNGFGSTRQIAVQPSTAGSDDFLWRVSVAEVDSAAPFSVFPGIDRHIVLLDGAGFTMTLDDRRTHALTTPLAPFAFPGEAKVAVRLAGGPTRDFNLMVRRALARGTVDVWREPGVHRLDRQTVLVYAVHGEIDTADGALQAGDAWRASAPAAGTVTLHDGAQALSIHIERTA